MSQMFEKYKVNSYPDFVENYYSDNGLDKVKPSFENKQSTCFSHELYSNNSFPSTLKKPTITLCFNLTLKIVLEVLNIII